MRTIWQALAWKEWHEHKWKLASILAILIGVTSMPMFVFENDRFGSAFGMLMLCSVPLALFLGLSSAAGERSRNTMDFTQSLPTSMRNIALAKLIAGTITIITAVALTAVSLYIWYAFFKLFGLSAGDARTVIKDGAVLFASDFFVGVAIFCPLISLSIYLWASACGVNRKDEISAAAVALAIMAGWTATLLAIFWSCFSDGTVSDATGWVLVAAMSTIPGGFAFVFSKLGFAREQLAACVFISSILHLFLAAIYVNWFGRIENREVVSPQFASRSRTSADWLGPPRRSTLTAIAWKQFRESAPIVVAGLAFIAGTTVLFYISNRNAWSSFDEVAGSVSMTIGIGLAMVVGIGVVLNDMKPDINTFWRSRPIDNDQWFWIKFLSGMAVLLAAVYCPLVLLSLFGSRSLMDLAAHPDAWIFPPLHITIFAAAVAMTCLIRQAVYAAILSIAAAVSGILVVGLSLKAAALFGWLTRPREHLPDMTVPQAMLGLGISFVICTLLAWLAVRNDWGQKSVR